jgi:hypothetical protein
LKQILTLIKFNLLQSIRSRKAFVFFGFYLAILYFMSIGFIKIQEEIFREFARQGLSEQTSEVMLRFVVRFLHTEKGPIIDYIMTIPFFNIILFSTTIFVTPLIILIIKYDILSQEIDDKTLRYQLIRTSRNRIYLAKTISSIIEVGCISLIAVLLAVIVANAQIYDLNFKKTFMFSLYFWGILQIHLFFFITYIQLMSTFIQKNYVLLVSALIIFSMYLVQIWIKYISPLDFIYFRKLFFGPSLELLTSLLVYVMFGIFFFLVGLKFFKVKNI